MRAFVLCNIWLAFLLWVGLPVVAGEIKFVHLDVTEGLSQGSVFAIGQDYQGLIWIGTRDGLNKYDAKRFTVYRNKPNDSTSLSDNFVQAIVEDSQNRLWIGTSNGLNIYNRAYDSFQRVQMGNFEVSNLQAEPSVHAVMEDRFGKVWVGTNQGLFRIKEIDGRMMAELIFNTLQLNVGGTNEIFRDVRYLYQDSDFHFWICTEEGLVQATYQPQQGNRLKILNYYFGDIEHKSLTKPGITSIVEVQKNIFWVGTKHQGIYVLNKQTGTYTPLAHHVKAIGGSLSSDIRSLLKDRQGRLWIGTFNGLSLYDQGKFQTFVASDINEHSLSNNSVRPIFQDKKGSIWVGTYFGGVNIIDTDLPNFINYTHRLQQHTLSYNVVSSFQEDLHGNLWIGTEGGGLNYFDTKQKIFQHFRHQKNNPSSLSHNNVKSLCLDHAGNLWVGTYQGGLDVLRKGTTTFDHFVNDPNNNQSLANNSVYALLEDATGNLWVGTYGGGLDVKRSHSETIGFNHYTAENKQITNNLIRVIYEDTEQNLWVGTQNGLNVKSKEEDRFKFIRHDPNNPKSISGNLIISIYEDHLHQIWIGTYKDGLNRYDPETDTFTRYNENNGLPGNNIFGIVEDRANNLWISTNAGIAKLNPETGLVRTYNQIDGLVGNEFIFGASYQMTNGNMVFGSSSGFTLFNPDSIRVNNYQPPVIFTDLKLFNKKVYPDSDGVLKQDISVSKQLTLNYKQHVFTIEFAALNYVLPQKNKYAYMLQGFDEAWNYVSTPAATYTNLDPGTYTLLVRGANNDGVWNEVPATLKIHILPPPWRTWWAYTFYIGLLGAIVYGLIRFFKTRNKLKRDLLIEHLALEKQQEVHEAKMNFFTNISHEFRTPLTLILGPIERLLAERDIQNHFKPLLQNAQRNANRLLHLVNQLLDFRKQESGHLQLQVTEVHLETFLHDMLAGFAYYAQQKNIELIHKQSIYPNLKVWIDTEQMEKVLSNLLYNAIKFTPMGGKIRVETIVQEPSEAYPNGTFSLAIADTGCGIPEQDLEHVFNQFYQLHHPDECEQPMGSGIGLALSASLVKMHRGTIYAESNLAKANHPFNTCFYVILPLGNDHFAPAQLSEKAFAIERHIEDAVEKQVVPQTDILTDEIQLNQDDTLPVLLVVEDNVELRTFIVQGLIEKYQVLEAGNGVEAWEIVQYAQPDLVLSDVMMPISDGIDLLQKIKANRETNHIPIILLTARTAVAYITGALEKGSDDYITKPFNFEILCLKIANLLDNRKRFREKFIREYLLQPQQNETAVKTNSFLDELVAIVEANLCNDHFGVNLLAREVGVSRTVLYRKLKQLTDLNLIEFIKLVRLRKAAQLLKSQSDLTISEIAYQVGFSDPKYFSKSFKAFYKISPKTYALQHDDISPI